MRIGLALCVLLGLPSVVSAQTTPAKFFAIDLDGGFFGHSAVGVEKPAEGEPNTIDHAGWRIGADLRPTRLAGVVVEFGRTTNDARSFQHYVVGTRVSTPWSQGDIPVRGFAHALIGLAQAGPSSTAPAETGLQLVAGAGYDWGIFRMQIDYMRLDLTGVPANQIRGFIGGVVGLCFHGCMDKDVAIDLSKR